ncbi:putative pumilio-repeat, RNA-binding protein [Trypanosoma theileri]|uniref:Putative pumilio-repeat, RNA-binding protein n=1 Tax=Trypanosoma theileri TaxID=67003 RepID=A0A1X0P4M4_9TRYP|nr:putative pumilio-repeat, RNA-binding protein [Trypanosoma theileri]ORC91788.1 putative pumilio-repeat, RNA-binding protein [Trypanosoma theileri]
MMERPSGPMHDVIRRVHEDVRVHSNYQNAIKTVTMALLHAKFCDNSSLGQDNSLRSPSLDRTRSAPERDNDGRIRNSQVTSSFSSSMGTNRTNRSLSGHDIIQGVVVQGDSDGVNGSIQAQPRLLLNRTQMLRLLLLRADAYSAMKQHEKAMEDAQAAAAYSLGRSPEAQFIMGREYLRLFRIAEAVNAFEKAELLLLSTSASDRNSFAEEVTDEDFWAQRGFQMKDIERLKLNRSEVEQQERTKLIGSMAEHNNGEVTLARSFSSPPGSLEVLGSDDPELVQWRRLAKEARALLTMRTSHLLPINVLQSTLMVLNRQMSSVRNGVVICIENTTSQSFRLVGYSIPNATFYEGMHFPGTIPPGHCGLSQLQSQGWGVFPFTGCVCYEVAQSGVRFFFVFESPLIGNILCGVRFVSERRISELNQVLMDSNGSMSRNYSNSGASSKEFVNFKIPNPNQCLAKDVAPLPSGRRLKLSAAVRSGSRTIVFSAAEVLDLRLRSVELLTALEFAGPVVLKKLSIVNKRYRELVNNLPPPMFFGGGRCSFPDYALRSDRTISPWIVHDKEPVNWYCIFDGRTINRENFVVADSTDPQNSILWFSAESGASLDAFVYYGDKRSPIAQIKTKWKLFGSTLCFSTPSDRTFASCYLDQNSNLTLAWDAAGKKSKAEDVEYVMRLKETVRRRDTSGRGDSFSNASLFGNNNNNSMDGCTSMPLPTGTGGFMPCNVISTPKTNVTIAGETYAVWRPQRTSGGTVLSSIPSQTNGGMELVGEVTVLTPITQTLVKNTTVAEIKIFAGTDALLLTLMAFCRSQWEN